MQKIKNQLLPCISYETTVLCISANALASPCILYRPLAGVVEWLWMGWAQQAFLEHNMQHDMLQQQLNHMLLLS